ncbi:MAG: tetratricopeptide repeat protein [Bacteroidales bacterium]|nr:tetratricopeptide repeat protein [Bacteroidales bacterium]
MKRLVSILASVAVSASILSAQDFNTVAAAFNSAIQLEDKTQSITALRAVIPQAQALGEEGAAIVENAKAGILSAQETIAKTQFNDKEFDGAIAAFEQLKALADEFGRPDDKKEADANIQRAWFSKGLVALQAKDFVSAEEPFAKAVELKADDGMAWFRLGQVKNALKKTDEAVEAFQKAAQFGQEANANKQLGNIYLKQGSAALKAGKSQEAIDALSKVNDYTPNAQVYKLIGNANRNLNKNADAIAAYEKYLEAAPDAADAATVKEIITQLKK